MFFGRRVFQYFRVAASTQKRAVPKLFCAGSALAATLVFATVEAYDPTPAKVVATGAKERTAEQKFDLIMIRFQHVCNQLGMTEVQTQFALANFFPHLKDQETFAKVLERHQSIAGEILKERGHAVFIDHTILKADATKSQVEALCKEAKDYAFGSVCVNGGRARQASQSLQDAPVNVAAVVGFPLGASTTNSKRSEAAEMWISGCQEVDVVVDVGRIKDGDYKYVRDQLQSLSHDAKRIQPDSPKVIKVIFETCLLTEEQIVDTSILCVLAGIGCVKTSTGFSTAGATTHDVELMRLTVGNKIGVKASGGVRDKETMEKMIHHGASLIGTSSGLAICAGAKKEGTFVRRLPDHCCTTTE